jgi:hypothetical protein
MSAPLDVCFFCMLKRPHDLSLSCEQPTMYDIRMHVLRAAEAADYSSPTCMISLMYYGAG